MTPKLKNALKEYFVLNHYSFKDEYYLEDAEKNTFEGIKDHFKEMFKNGNGGELSEKKDGSNKAEAIHSSSMLAYNFFSWIDEKNPFIYEGVLYDKVVFEEQLRVLKKGTKNGTDFRNSNSKANMDVVLAGKNKDGQSSLLFIESKFTEHLTNSRSDLTNMVLSYSTPNCYFDQEEGKKWSLLVENWKKKANNKSIKGYFSGIKQDICHLIAIGNLMNNITRGWFNTTGSSGEGSWLKKVHKVTIDGNEDIKFRNVIFSPSQQFATDKECVDNYRHLYQKFENEVKGIISPKLNIGLITYLDLWKEMEKCINDEYLKRYLCDRYIKFQV